MFEDVITPHFEIIKPGTGMKTQDCVAYTTTCGVLVDVK